MTDKSDRVTESVVELEEALEGVRRLLDYTLFHDSGLVEDADEAKQSPVVTAGKRAIAFLEALTTRSQPGEDAVARAEEVLARYWNGLGFQRSSIVRKMLEAAALNVAALPVEITDAMVEAAANEAAPYVMMQQGKGSGRRKNEERKIARRVLEAALTPSKDK